AERVCARGTCRPIWGFPPLHAGPAGHGTMRRLGRHLLGDPRVPEGGELPRRQHAGGRQQAHRLLGRIPPLPPRAISVRLLRGAPRPTSTDPDHRVLSVPRQPGHHEDRSHEAHGEGRRLPGRVVLYIAFREWLAPGDRILMSPVDDDVVFFTVLAAGLVPVLGPIDPDTGNLDPKAIDDATWSRLRAVLTTNLYGIPDAMEVLEERCHRHGLILFEDACQAFDTRVDGKRIGTFGTAAAFSLGKHLEIPGGVLVFPDSSRRDSLQRRAREALRTRPHSAVTAYKALTFLTTVGGPGWAPRWLGHLVGQGVLPSDRWR